MSRKRWIAEAIDGIFHFRKGWMTEELQREKISPHMPQVPARLVPDAVTTSVCGYCSTGCSLKVHLKDGEAINLSPHNKYPVNQGMACPKGWEALTVLEDESRGTTPLLRTDAGELQAVDWNVATQAFTERFRDIIQEHGPESVAWLGTGQTTVEEMAFLGALTKFGMGWVHGDGNTRQCMATAATAYKQSFGFDAPPYTYADFEESDVIVLIGSNLCIAHPIMWQRIMQNRRNPKIIVIDPRNTETAQLATDHYAIQPKSDLCFFYGIAHILLLKGWIDRDYIEKHTNGFLDFEKFIADYSPLKVAVETGIPVVRLYELAEMIHGNERVSFWWTMGVNQSHQSTRTTQSIINLALMTGNMGRPGTGANSITGQCNAMGSRLFSNTTSLMGGYDFLNAEHRHVVSEKLGIDESVIPQVNSLAYDQIFDGIREGKIRGLWVVATNPAHSWIHQTDAVEVLKKLDFLVVQDMYHDTHTAKLADLYLPAAAWGEKEGTFINSERRIGVIRKVKTPPGEALSDFDICRKISVAWGCNSMFGKWESPESVFKILCDLTEGRPCDISGLKEYDEIAKKGGVQWPFPKKEVLENITKERRLFEDGGYFHADGKAKFLFSNPLPLPEPVSDKYPIILITGRGTSAQWHTQTRTEKSAILKKLYPAHAYVEVNPEDAAKQGISTGSIVWVLSARADVEVFARISNTVQRGTVFMPMHYLETNKLTFPSFDTHSRQPAYKACAVRIEQKN